MYQQAHARYLPFAPQQILCTMEYESKKRIKSFTEYWRCNFYCEVRSSPSLPNNLVQRMDERNWETPPPS